MYKFEQGAIILPLPMAEQSGSFDEGAADLLDPYDRLITLEIMGNAVSVPEKNRLLRCFQYLSINTISYGDFCWNGECLNCQAWIKMGDKEKAVIACRTNVEEGMEIVRVSKEMEIS